jgi:hypothetical protein
MPKVAIDPDQANRGVSHDDRGTWCRRIGDQEALRRPERLRGSVQTEHVGELNRRQRAKAV